MNLKNKLPLLVALLFSVTMFAQESYLLKGTVVSEVDQQPIPGVNVLVLNTTRGASTDFDGNFEINVASGEVLQFSYLGYVTSTVIVSDQQTLSISLAEDAAQLDEVVVIGYGTQRKSHLTGAISKVKNEDLDQIAVPRVDEALVGQVSGVTIAATEGEAGSAPTIRIRGTGSISGDSSPAIVVDGLVVDSDFLGNLDMNEVESFEVLKDAASAAIYGSRGANGVILITTKQGKAGKTKFTYNVFTGFKEARQSDDYYFTVAETARAEKAATGTISDRTRVKQLIGTDRDWQDVIFDGGIIESHSFAARGGNENTKFSLSLNYVHDEGVLLTDDYKKYSLRLKVNSKINDKFSIGANLSPSYSNRRRFDGSTHDILRQTPWLPLYIDASNIQYVNRLRDGGKYANVKIGDYAEQRMFDDFDLDTMSPVESGGTDISNTSNTNPAAKVLERDRNDYKFKLAGSVFAKYNITDNFSFRTTLSGDFQNTKRDRWQGVLSSRNGASATQLDLSTQNRIHFVTDNIFSYDKIFGKHEIGAIVGFSAEKWDTNFESTSGAGYDSDLLQTITAADPTTVTSVSYEIPERLISYLARLNYSYDNKYLASVSFRRDGFSSFGEDSKYGNFAAASVGWIVSNEDFLNESEVVNMLKIRMSYGVSGNPFLRSGDPIVDAFPYLPLLQSSTAVVDGDVEPGFNSINFANPNLQWERSIEINPGIDFGLFNNIVSGSVEYYKRTSDQLLIDNPISGTTGLDSRLVNIGEVENSGFELELRTRNISKEKFKWSTTMLVSKNENKLVNFADSDGQIQNVDSKRAAEWINQVGNPISSFYGWVVDRDIPLQYINNPYHPVGGEAQDVYVKDLNGDGIIDDDDKTILGDPYPDIVWSLTNDFKVGDFDLSFMFQGSHGAEIRNMGDQYIFNHFNSAQDYTADTPNKEFIKEKIFTDDIIQDASYIALRNVNIGYTLPQSLLSKIFLTKARVYASGTNLLYFTASDYTGFNPESINDTSPTTYGYQRAGSPVQQTISLGLNLEF
ncbi:SusC/RagA family TonB-linked outer membrane protein [Psychroserpens ponticola]|uniref:TonB-dependent receptor n=1 Tax=Psychroserpens ponticola TaxID=2932268 RepID=A0ABY7RUU6_9FLAO|nr:TonB-dependent receptor [Psychroserpens ponticola]WCO00892.1 TonB-dependent receptor [Psychroserpens ponticola]